MSNKSNKKRKPTVIGHESENVRVSMFFKSFADKKTLCTVSVKIKGIGKKWTFDTHARRNVEMDTVFDDSVGISVSSERAITKLKKQAINIDKEADMFLERYLELRKYSTAINNAAYDLEARISEAVANDSLETRKMPDGE